MDVERTFAVRQPVRHLFECLKDFANTEAWDPGTAICTRVDARPIETAVNPGTINRNSGAVALNSPTGSSMWKRPDWLL